MNRIIFSLCIMMFLQYAVYGIWLPISSVFIVAPVDIGGLGFTEGQRGLIIAVAAAIGAISAPFLVGQLTDRHFSTEKSLGFLLITGGIIKFATAYQTSFFAWLVLSILYAILYMPAIALTNSLAMRHLKSPKKEFPKVRVWGTIGWIAVAWFFPFFWLKTNIEFQWKPPFYTGEDLPNVMARMIDSVKIAGVLSVGYGFFAFFCLPHTPPTKEKVESLAFVKAFRLLKKPSFAILFGSTLLISILHFIHLMQNGNFLKHFGLNPSDVAPASSIGQFAEIFMLAILGKLLSRFGFKNVILLGASFFTLRCLLFGTTSLPLSAMIFGQALHGICFACFYAACFIYIDRVSPKDIRNSTQSMYTLVMLGLSPLAAAFINSKLATWYGVDGVLVASSFSSYWYTLAVIGGIAVALLALFFKDETAEAEEPLLVDKPNIANAKS